MHEHPLPAVNADEWEIPAPQEDRLLMEQLPHLLVEGMLILAFALKAHRGYIFPRGEYIEAAGTSAPCDCRSHRGRAAGQKISWAPGSTLNCFVHTGAGRYICGGEETALINPLEGRRANSCSKPPFWRPAYGASRPV
ncbi:hypothetical protein KCP78_11030 [Salmonella enterica subsp. enterica]|nr:hypothetical protein KCP78_11030 [Salmonella enterica subsp. enterica]